MGPHFRNKSPEAAAEFHAARLVRSRSFPIHDSRSAAMFQVQPPLCRQLTVGFRDGIEMDAQFHRHAPHGGQRRTGSEFLFNQKNAHTINDLTDNRNFRSWINAEHHLESV